MFDAITFVATFFLMVTVVVNATHWIAYGDVPGSTTLAKVRTYRAARAAR